ncbi:MAG: acylphosphatase, partial [Leptolyngbya sp. SIO1D8]|nr:acylphosphatase [Leptolyngbya sp. SIO1D8]
HAKASQLGLTGYVRNRPDGTVEIVAEGTSQSIQHLLEWARQGPPAAEVQQMDVNYGTANGEFGTFSIER